MKQSRIETFLARIYTQNDARSRFLKDPAGEAARAGLSPEEARSLESIDRIGLELAAASFASKRARRGPRASDRIAMQTIYSIFYFLLAGLCEIGGGYLVWLWLKEGRPAWYGIAGAVLLCLYGVIPTLQPSNFGRVYAAYGGMFVALSVLWGWSVDGTRPDRFDIIGALICLAGVAIIFYVPRHA